MSEFIPGNIPQEMKDLPRWVLFTLFENVYSKRLEKLPWSVNGKMADITRPETWTTFDRALSVLQKNKTYRGLGFVLGEGIFGIDLDHVISDDGIMEPWAEEIIRMMDSYTELSPSGKGVHIYARGKIPPKDRKNGKVEMYDERRYFTVTGNVYGEPKPLAERTREAAAVHRQYLKRDHRESTPQEAAVVSKVVSRDVGELINRAEKAKNGDKFSMLYKGSTMGYASQSQADQALCNILAFYAGGDRTLIDAAFRSSGLMRTKWDSRRGSTTYGEMTIEKALASVRSQFSSAALPAGIPLPVDIKETDQDPAGKEDVSNNTSVDIKEKICCEDEQKKERKEEKEEEKRKGIEEEEKNKKEADKREIKKETVIKHDMNESTSSSGRFTDIRTAWKNGLIFGKDQTCRAKTGIEELDRRIGGIGKGIWLLGSEPSIGKTSLALRMARFAAEDGAEVLYISFEQEEAYLEAKLIAAEMTERTGMKISPESVLEGERMAEITSITEEEVFFGRIHFVPGATCTNDKALLGVIEEFSDLRKPCADRRNRPCIVFIDYLQIIPFSGGSGIRAQIDDFARSLRQLQMRKGICVFLISSLNRMSYMGPVRLDSFKESGIIEFTGDVILGLNLRSVRSADFARLADAGEKAARLEAARSRRVRELEISVLKNKTGESSFSVDVNFDTGSGLFTCVKAR
ncbi:MAG: hypothetical protein IKP22_11730 [Clostridia bacterium]|nr:hypothetical protein [Clostridia bacterium]